MEITLIVLSLLATGAGAPGPCSLLARADILAVQKAAVVSKGERRRRKTVEIRRCYYETDPNSKVGQPRMDPRPGSGRGPPAVGPAVPPGTGRSPRGRGKGREGRARGAASRTAGSGLRHRRRSLLGTEPRERRDLRVRIARLRPGERGGRGNGRGKKDRATALAKSAIAAATAPKQGATPR